MFCQIIRVTVFLFSFGLMHPYLFHSLGYVALLLPDLLGVGVRGGTGSVIGEERRNQGERALNHEFQVATDRPMVAVLEEIRRVLKTLRGIPLVGGWTEREKRESGRKSSLP